MARTLIALLRIVVVVALVLAIVAGLLFFWVVVRGLPQREGTALLPGLSGDVTVKRDEHGIPHLYASTEEDLFAAQGYIHASERMWQMEVWRHIGAGRLSELFGANQVDADRFIRTLGWRRAAERDLAAVSADTRRGLEAYARGVNAWLDAREALPLPFVVTGMLGGGGGLVGYRPEPWSPLDTMTWAKVQAWQLGGDWDAEVFRSLASHKLDPAMVDELFPAYRDDRPVIVPSGAPGSGGAGASRALPSVAAGAGSSGPEHDRAGSPPSVGNPDAAGLLALTSLGDQVRSLSGLGSARGGPIASTGLGSNGWVVGPGRTSSGSAMLANDPHLGVSMPSVWYLIGLHCRPLGPDCPYEAAGAGFPGVPAVVLGHNATIAWGLTNLGPDVQDLFVEELDATDPDRYRYRGQSLEMTSRTETIRVAGGEDVPLVVRETIHGPVISDVVEDLQPRSAGADGQTGSSLVEPGVVFALRWTAIAEEDHSLEAILGINRAGDFAAFREALRGFGAPSQTFLFADVEGHIGLQAAGRIPIRASGDGSAPVAGSEGAFDWTGYVLFDDLPYLFDPPEGVIVSANNAPVDAGYPRLLGRLWDPGYRAARIQERLRASGRLGPGEVRAIQGDVHLSAAGEVVPYLAAATPATDDGRLLRDRIAAWQDLECDAASIGCAAYETFEYHLLRAVFDDELGASGREGLARRYVGSLISREALRGLLARPNSRWWDDATTSGLAETRDERISAALDRAAADLRAQLGAPEGWTWGAVHRVAFREQTLGESGVGLLELILNRGPFAAAGSCATISRVCADLSAAYPAPDESAPQPPPSLQRVFEASTIPSYRLVIDLSDVDSGRIIQTTGQSGVPFDAHYDDLIDDWLANRAVNLPWRVETVDTQTVQTLVLRP
jgi:penicillin amidase